MKHTLQSLRPRCLNKASYRLQLAQRVAVASVRAVGLDHISRPGVAPTPSPIRIQRIWSVRFAQFGFDGTVWLGKSICSLGPNRLF